MIKLPYRYVLIFVCIAACFLWLKYGTPEDNDRVRTPDTHTKRDLGNTAERQARRLPSNSPLPARIEENIARVRYLLKGQVRTPEGTPVAEATLSVFTSRNQRTRDLVGLLASTSSRASSVYRLPLSSKSQAWIAAEKAGFVPVEERFFFSQPGICCSVASREWPTDSWVPSASENLTSFMATILKFQDTAPERDSSLNLPLLGSGKERSLWTANLRLL